MNFISLKKVKNIETHIRATVEQMLLIMQNNFFNLAKYNFIFRFKNRSNRPQLNHQFN